MGIRVSTPSGATIEFPDGTDEGTIHRVMAEAMGGKQDAPAASAKPIDPMREAARQKVSEYRKANPTMTMVDDTVRNLARGTGLGSFLDEANAATASVLPQFLGGMPYDEALAIERAKNELADNESTVVGKLPVVGDVTVGGLTKLAGGIASAPVTPMARVFQGATLAPRVANAAVTGAGYGAAYGFGEGEGVQDRLGNAAVGGAIGAGIGGAAPIVASGVSNAVSAAANRAAPLDRNVAMFDRSAVDRLATVYNRGIEQNQINNNVVRQRQQLHGREGMLADIDGSFRDVTEAIAQQPGPQRQVVQRALEGRDNNAPHRINHEINLALGAPRALADVERAVRQHYSREAAPLYREFYQTRIPVDGELVSILQAAPDEVWPRVQRLMRAERLDPGNVMNTGHGIDLIKRALDDTARNAGRGTNEERVISNLARQLREHVDGLISPDNPAQSSWARAREIAGEGIGAREAIETGSGVFSRKMDPQQLAAEMQGMSAMEQEMVRAGGRADLRNIMGRAATNFGPNGDAAGRRALNSEFNRENIRQIAGQPAADRLLQRVQAENDFAETFNQVLRNSATARRQAGRDIVPRQYDQSQMASLRGTSLTGIVAEGAARIANIVSAGALNERNQRIATDMARMLVARGASRDQIISGLMIASRRNNMAGQRRERLDGFVQSLMTGSTPTAISAATSDR